jgi:hypothetical protein
MEPVLRLVRPPRRLWDRLLLAACGLVCVMGQAMALAAGPVSDVFDQMLFGGAGPITDGAGRDYLELVYRVLGAGLVGWAVALAALARVLRRRERSAWWAVVVSLSAWFLLDTGSSLACGFPENAMLNVGLAVLMAVPLVGMWSELDRKLQAEA